MYPLHKKNPTLQIFVWQSLKLSCTIFLWISCWPWTTYIKNESGIKNIFVPQVLKKNYDFIARAGELHTLWGSGSWYFLQVALSSAPTLAHLPAHVIDFLAGLYIVPLNLKAFPIACPVWKSFINHLFLPTIPLFLSFVFFSSFSPLLFFSYSSFSLFFFPSFLPLWKA